MLTQDSLIHLGSFWHGLYDQKNKRLGEPNDTMWTSFLTCHLLIPRKPLSVLLR
eukprot:m.307622 g.307622  ORF g.307622 m.307622 type:complete len:54 (+) comp19629_c0_seq7:303-464(+)